MKIYITIVILFIHLKSFGYDTQSFSTDLNTLNRITINYSSHRDKFKNDKYSKYVLFRAITLNDFIINNEISKSTVKYYCQNDKNELLNLLKWKISVENNKELLNQLGVNCKEQVSKYESIMETYFVDAQFFDATVEYYKYLEKNNMSDFVYKNSLLRSILYSKPSVSALELLITNLKKKGLLDGEWNASILAARYGSNKGFENMIKLSSDDSDFIEKVKEYLW